MTDRFTCFPLAQRVETKELLPSPWKWHGSRDETGDHLVSFEYDYDPRKDGKEWHFSLNPQGLKTGRRTTLYLTTENKAYKSLKLTFRAKVRRQTELVKVIVVARDEGGGIAHSAEVSIGSTPVSHIITATNYGYIHIEQIDIVANNDVYVTEMCFGEYTEIPFAAGPGIPSPHQDLKKYGSTSPILERLEHIEAEVGQLRTMLERSSKARDAST